MEARVRPLEGSPFEFRSRSFISPAPRSTNFPSLEPRDKDLFDLRSLDGRTTNLPDLRTVAQRALVEQNNARQISRPRKQCDYEPSESGWASSVSGWTVRPTRRRGHHHHHQKSQKRVADIDGWSTIVSEDGWESRRKGRATRNTHAVVPFYQSLPPPGAMVMDLAISPVQSTSMLTCNQEFKNKFPNVYLGICKGMVDIRKLMSYEIVIPVKEDVSLRRATIRYAIR